MTQRSGLSGDAAGRAVWALAYAHPVLRPVFDEHLADNVPDPGQPDSELRALLGPGLASVDPWLNELQG